MKGFHLLVQIFCVRTVKDTQCGYKLFTRSAAQRILPQVSFVFIKIDSIGIFSFIFNVGLLM